MTMEAALRYRDIHYRLLASATLLTLSAVSALAQAQGDPLAPLSILKTAREKAASSQLNAANITTGGNNAGIVFTVIFAVVGMGLAGISGVKLYKSSQDDNAREDAGRSLAGWPAP